jgi:hypothetical protein
VQNRRVFASGHVSTPWMFRHYHYQLQSSVIFQTTPKYVLLRAFWVFVMPAGSSVSFRIMKKGIRARHRLRMNFFRDQGTKSYNYFWSPFLSISADGLHDSCRLGSRGMPLYISFLQIFQCQNCRLFRIVSAFFLI